MYNIPIFFKAIINFVAYVFYTIFFSLFFSFIFPIILKLLGKNVLDPSNPIFTKIQVVLAVVVLLITVVYRKYFYISMGKVEVTQEKKTESKQKKVAVEHFMEDDDIKIYVDKEIKR